MRSKRRFDIRSRQTPSLRGSIAQGTLGTPQDFTERFRGKYRERNGALAAPWNADRTSQAQVGCLFQGLVTDTTAVGHLPKTIHPLSHCGSGVVPLGRDICTVAEILRSSAQWPLLLPNGSTCSVSQPRSNGVAVFCPHVEGVFAAQRIKDGNHKIEASEKPANVFSYRRFLCRSFD